MFSHRLQLIFCCAAFTSFSAARAETPSADLPTLRPPQVLKGNISIDDAQNLALKQNRDILQASVEMKRNEALLKAVMTTRYPKLTGIVFGGQQMNSTNGGYPQNLAVLPGIFQPVSQQYRLSLQVREAEAQLQISREHFRKVKQQSIAEVKKNFLSIIALQSSIDSLDENLRFLRELQRYVESEMKSGSALPVDALLVQARSAQADYDLEKARDDMETLSQTLNRLLGQEMRLQLHLVKNQQAFYPDENPQSVINMAINNRPELREVRLNIHRADLERRVQMSGYIPDVSVGVTAIVSRNLDVTLPRNLVAAGFLATWEPWDWGRRIQLSKEQNRKVLQEEIRLKDVSESVSIDVDQARRAVKLAQKEAIAGELAEVSNKEFLRVTHRRFVAGSALLKDVLEAQSSYVKAIAQNVKAKIDIATAHVALDEATGKDF